MSQVVCMDAMPENVPRNQRKMQRLSRHISMHASTLGITEAPPNLEATIRISNMADPPLNYDEVGTFQFHIKIVQLMLAIICSGLYSDAIYIVNTSTTDQLLPNIVCSGYMIINTITIMSYALGQKMPENSIRIFALLGCILFAAAGVISLRVWGSLNYEIHDNYSEKKKKVLRRGPPLLLAEGILSIFNATLYLIDACYSIRRAQAVNVPAA